MDYEELLKKYMRHIHDCEGSTFVQQIGDYISEQEFTDEEKAALEKLDDEIYS